VNDPMMNDSEMTMRLYMAISYMDRSAGGKRRLVTLTVTPEEQKENVLRPANNLCGKKEDLRTGHSFYASRCAKTAKNGIITCTRRKN
jgi:hypothetical protein